MLHFTFTQIKPLGFVAQYGFAGVDIFMFVSGFGLFFSLERDHNILHFYKKRLLRIFPTYYLIGAISALFLDHDNLPTYLFRYSTIGFWTNGIYHDWYIPSIVALYLISPFLKKLFNKHFIPIAITLIIFVFFITFICISKEYFGDRSRFFFLFSRIPAFIWGMTCAYWLKNNCSKTYYTIALIVGIPVFVWLFPQQHQIYNFKYLSLSLLLPAYTLFFIIITKYIRPVKGLLSPIGNASLEIYLIQGMFASSIIKGLITIPSQWHDIYTLGFILFCSIAGILFHWLIERSRISSLF